MNLCMGIGYEVLPPAPIKIGDCQSSDVTRWVKSKSPVANPAYRQAGGHILKIVQIKLIMQFVREELGVTS